MRPHNFKSLLVWQKGMKLVKEVYAISADFPDTERYGLQSQMRRCAVSIPSNIAEGTSYSSVKGVVRYIEIARGSAFELETQLLLARDIGFISTENSTAIIDLTCEVQKLCFGFIRSLRASESS